MTGNGRHVVNLIAKFNGIGECPDLDEGFYHVPDGRVLRHDKEPRTGFTRREVCTEVIDHRPAVMRYQNAPFESGAVQQFRIAHAIKTRLLTGNEIHRRLPPPRGLHFSELEVVVCLEPNAQERRSP